MRVYIECYYADDKQILGNLDGQAVIDAIDYRRTNAYKRLDRIVCNPNWIKGRVKYAKIVSKSGTLLEVYRGNQTVCNAAAK